MKSTTNLTGALSSASNSMPAVDLPNAATTSSSRSEEQCGMAIPKPMPVLMVSSRSKRGKNRVAICGFDFAKTNEQIDQLYDRRPALRCFHLWDDLLGRK